MDIILPALTSSKRIYSKLKPADVVIEMSCLAQSFIIGLNFVENDLCMFRMLNRM